MGFTQIYTHQHVTLIQSCYNTFDLWWVEGEFKDVANKIHPKCDCVSMCCSVSEMCSVKCALKFEMCSMKCDFLND